MAYRKALSPAAGLGPQPKSHQQAEEEAQQLLSRFGSHILKMLKAGGKSLENMDNRYADAVYDRIGGKDSNPFIAYTSTGPIGDMVRQDMGGDPRLMAAKYGTIGANIASRYALPAGGVMLAGKGLADLTNGLYDYASEQSIL